MRNIHNLDIENILLICPCIENDKYFIVKNKVDLYFVFKMLPNLYSTSKYQLRE